MFREVQPSLSGRKEELHCNGSGRRQSWKSACPHCGPSRCWKVQTGTGIEEYNSSVRSVFVKHELPIGIFAKRHKIWPLHAESLSKGHGGDSCHTGGSSGHILSVLWEPHVTHGIREPREAQCRPGGKSSQRLAFLPAVTC